MQEDEHRYATASAIKHKTAMKVMALHDLGKLSLSTLTPVLEDVRNQGLEEAAVRMMEFAGDSDITAKCADAIRAMKTP